MPATQLAGGDTCYLPKPGLQSLVAALQQEGYTVLGPAVVDGVICLQPIASADDIPRGVVDEQDGGRYRLREGDPELHFQFAVGPDGPKHYLFPSLLKLFRLRVEGSRFAIEERAPAPPKLAFLGIRPCEVAAIMVQDRVFGSWEAGTFRCEADPYYGQARSAAMILVVNCTRPGDTCFCVSMGTGPAARDGFDLALTELHGGFVVQVGSPRGAALVQKLPVREPSSTELELAALRLQLAASCMGRRLETEGLPEVLGKAIEHPHWDEVAKRCLGCTNCTQVCPTCFCSTVVDSTDLTGPGTTRTRLWESCYTHQFSYTTAGPVRTSIRARYRHWLRHKLSTWYDQFGVSGCVGCGRCITWCPVGIDLTVEAPAFRVGVKP